MTEEEKKPGIIYLGTAAELGWDEDSQPSEPLTNWDRADRAATALAAYHDETQGCDPGLGQSYGDEGEGVFSEAFQDLLTDLMHLADRAGLEFEELINRAVVNYDAENQEEEADG